MSPCVKLIMETVAVNHANKDHDTAVQTTTGNDIIMDVIIDVVHSYFIIQVI